MSPTAEEVRKHEEMARLQEDPEWLFEHAYPEVSDECIPQGVRIHGILSGKQYGSIKAPAPRKDWRYRLGNAIIGLGLWVRE